VILRYETGVFTDGDPETCVDFLAPEHMLLIDLGSLNTISSLRITFRGKCLHFYNTCINGFTYSSAHILDTINNVTSISLSSTHAL
jgi:hypothetical protein